MLTQQQINQFRRIAKAKGYSEIQISQEIARKNQQSTRTGLQPTQQTQPIQSVAPVAPITRSVSTQQPTQNTSLLQKIGRGAVDVGKSIIEPITTYTKAETARQKAILPKDRLKESVKSSLAGPLNILRTGEGRRAAADIASFAVPVGKGVKAAVKLGAVSGALFGLSQKDATVEDVLMSSAGGAVGGAIAPAISKTLSKGKKFVSGGYKKLLEKPREALSNMAAKKINKASPSMWDKAVREHGLDLNKLTKKYFPKGGGYDDLLGSISERGKGGIFKNTIKKAESKITKEFKNVNSNTKIPIDDLVRELDKEKKLILQLPGNENNAKALDEFIAGLKAQYGKGITPKKMLAMKRIADSQFGRAVADENTGSAIAQAQKMVANSFRAKLKKLFPKVADALETETEVYTLQPIFNRARGILNTQGSEIRVGSLKGKSLLELANPFNLLDSYLADPKRASRLLKTKISPEELSKLSVGDTSSFLSKFAGRSIGATGTGITGAGIGEEEQINMPKDGQYTDSNQNINQEQSDLLTDDSISQANVHPVFGNKTKQEVLIDAFNKGLNMKQIDEIESIYDRFSTEGNEEQINDLLEKRKLYSDQGFSTAEIDNQLKKLGISKDEMSSSKSEYAPAVSRSLKKLEEISKINTKDSMFKGSATTIGKKASEIRTSTKKATNEKFATQVNTYKDSLNLIVGSINQMLGAGVLNKDEAERLINSMPDENSSEKEAKAWFDNARTILGVE